MSKKFSRVLVVSVIAAVLLLALTLPALAKRSVFVGSWKGTDSTDGSTITLHIGGPRADGSYNVVMIDDYSGSCSDVFEEPLRDWSKLRGSVGVDGNVLNATGPLWCLSNPPVFLFNIHPNFKYEENDTLVVWFTTFHRIGY